MWRAVTKMAGPAGFGGQFLWHGTPVADNFCCILQKNPRVGQLVLGHASIETFYKHYVLDEIPEDATEGLY